MDLTCSEISRIQNGLSSIAQKTEDISFREKVIKDGKFKAEDFFKFTYLVGRYMDLSAPILEKVAKEKNKLLKEYGVAEEVNGKQTGRYNVTNENLETYTAALKAIDDTKETFSNVRKLALSELNKLSVGSNVMFSLVPITKIDVEMKFEEDEEKTSEV